MHQHSTKWPIWPSRLLPSTSTTARRKALEEVVPKAEEHSRSVAALLAVPNRGAKATPTRTALLRTLA